MEQRREEEEWKADDSNRPAAEDSPRLSTDESTSLSRLTIG